MSDIYRIVADLRHNTHSKEIDLFKKEMQRRQTLAERDGKRHTMVDMFWDLWSAYKQVHRIEG